MPLDNEARRLALEALGLPLDSLPTMGGAPTTPRPVPVPDVDAPPPLDGAELQRLLGERRESRLGVDLGRAGAMAAEAISGAKAPMELYAGLEKRTAEPVVEYFQRQRDATKAKGAAAKPVKSTDASSPESKRAQVLVKAVLGDKFSDDEIAQLTEADAENALKYGTLSGQREVTREGIAATNTRANADRQQRAEQFSAREGREWATLSQQERLKYLDMADKERDRESKAGEKSKEETTGLRKEFEGHQTVKDYRSSKVSVDKLRAAAKDPSAAGDLSLIFSFMKILDPGSVVKETEFANAQNATGVPDRIRNTWNKALSGERLSPRQRQDFITSAERLFTAQEGAYKELGAQYEELAPEGAAQRVVLPGKQGSPPKRAPAPSVMPKDAAGNLSLENPPPEDGKVRMVAPDGRQKLVPRSKVKAAIAAGGRLADG